MGVMIDIIGSTIIRGVIVLVILNLNVSLNNALAEKTARAIVKQKTVVPAQVITDDLRTAGYNMLQKTFPIAKADEVTITTDFDNNGIAETVHYYLGAAPAGSTHRILYRQLNGGASFELARDVVSLVFTYYDFVGGTVAPGLNINYIKSINVKLLIESNAQISEGIGTNNAPEYVQAYWERTIFPYNLWAW